MASFARHLATLRLVPPVLAACLAFCSFAGAQTYLRESPGFGPQQSPEAASIAGTVVDSNGAVVANATVTLSAEHTTDRTTHTDFSGHFSLAALPPGPARLTIASQGLEAHVTSIVLPAGQTTLPEIRLFLASASSSVEVVATREELGRAEVAEETRQRVLGLFPNYMVTYIGDAVPLTTRQKFSITARLQFDPVTIALTGVTAGIEQATNAFPGYGQGAAGFGKRFGATLADGVDASFLGGAILPTLFRQDPRYFFRGPGHTRTNRALYAIAAVVICRSDKGHWEPNYSNVLGNIGAASVSNIYYPASDRHGAGLTIDNALLGTAEGAIGNLIEEFLIRRITPHLPPYGSTPTQ